MLDELKGIPADVVSLLEKAGLKTLRDILDLEMDDVLKIEGLTQEHGEVLLAFLSELTEDAEDSAEDDEGAAEGEVKGGGNEPAEASPPNE